MPNLWHRDDVTRDRTSDLLPLHAAQVAFPRRETLFPRPSRTGKYSGRKVPAMRKVASPHLPSEVSAVKLEALRLALDVPLDAAASEETAAPASHVHTQLRFVQVGVWEARRRC